MFDQWQVNTYVRVMEGSGEEMEQPEPSSPKSVFERPLFWLAMVAGGVALAVVLSLLAEKTDLGGRAGDVGHYCQQVAVIKRTNFASLGVDATDSSDQAAQLVTELRVLEHVAPSNVGDDVHEIRLSADDALAALRAADKSDPDSYARLLVILQQAQTRSEDAIDQMTEYTQEACGIDLTPAETSVTSTSTRVP